MPSSHRRPRRTAPYTSLVGATDKGFGVGREVEKTAKDLTLVGEGRRPPVGIDFEAVRIAVGAALRRLYSDVLREPIPDRIAELLRQLDEQLRQLDQDTDKA